MTPESLSIFYGIASAAVWGTGDFCGGLAAKRTDVYRVVLLAHLFGLFVMAGLALGLKEQMPTATDLLFGALAGLGGMMGVLAFYQGLSQSRMGVIAPIAAIVTAIIPITVGMWSEGVPPTFQLLGMGLALFAVWFLAGSDGLAGVQWRELGYPALAGIGFALFLLLINQVTDGSVFWPLVAARSASSCFLFVVTRFRPSSQMPGWNQLIIIALAGLFDAGGNALFTLAAQSGRLDIASILSSLYPASTVLLAWLILGERLSVAQRWGAGLAFVALVLITL